jgi:hypothetical protein
MNLPSDSKVKTGKSKVSKPQKWIVILSIIATMVSLASAGFSAFMYFNTPLQIHNYVQSHKNELRGKDGSDGRDGMDGRNGINSYSPTHCSSYDYGSGYISTNCY